MAHLNSAWKAGLACWITGTLSGTAMADPSAGGNWQKYTPTSAVRGADGKMHAATCSGYPGTDKTYSFWAKRGKSENLVVYFEGGGACWDNLTCTFPIMNGLPEQVPQFFMPAVPADANPANYSGIFQSSNPANPVKDWSMVYIPYCTGDLHTGSSTKTYYNAGHPVFQWLPGEFQIEHRGFDNFMVVLDFVTRKFREPEKVLVAGSSAGGYGATANAPWIQRSYPEAKLSVLADASQGVTTQAFDTGNPGRNSWNIQLAPWVFGTDPSLVSGPDLMRVAAKGMPRAKVGQFTTEFDAVQIGFYGVMKAYYGPGGACPNPALDWHNQATSKVQADSDALSNYHYYVASGQYHTNLRSPQFYLESSAGTQYRDWVNAMLGLRANQQDTHGRVWVDASCPTCLLQYPCP